MSDWSRSCVTSRKVALACRPLVREQMLCSQKEQVGTKDYISSPSVTNNNYENALYNLWSCSEVYFVSHSSWVAPTPPPHPPFPLERVL